ncbi:hypothetical protein B0H63DRAFT_144390 [Podospora didyma]|uniref:Uncharacterized protein n=1 Tax=Podospora didyma TaxID=330526 RepID=A0AAE0NSN5_9PEZI|nr:hypothetical protein B0H63DRAFT_144390 [Podospora didyma]
MTSRGEILDSEDEGSDFSPPKLKVEDDFVQLIDADADMTASHLQPTSQAVRSTDSVEFDSTNPSDLENMHQAYEEHAAAAQGEKDAASQPARSLKSTAKSASSTDVSVVERVRNEQLSAALAKKRAKPEKKPEENADVWDVPSSPLRRPTSSSKRATKTYGKRRRTGQQSSPPQHGNTNDIPPTQNPHSTVYDLTESSPVAPVKRQKTRATRSSASMEKDSDTPVAIPIFQAPSDSNQRSSRSGHGKKESSSYNFDSSLPEMPSASIYIAPSALTASQKREYKTISLSSFQSELGHGSPASPLPNLNFDVGEGMQHRSSGATVSTIANTPGRYAPSRLTAVLSDDLTHDEPGSSTGPPGRYLLQISYP